MPKTAILYQSPHHGNTKKLLDAVVAAHPDVELIKAGEDVFNPDAYDRIGLASGIYMGKLHKAVRKALEAIHPNGKKVFILYTCGDSKGAAYGMNIMDMLRQKGFETCGNYWCLGHDSVGPLRLIGGIHKDRPNEEDIRGAVKFYENLKE